ncbi:MAG TPA: glycoside hydrolase family 57 protein [Pseudomonadales bacterium]|nr:glycoside hydrolase family 57 protein [Pseudomonadales bacterium]
MSAESFTPVVLMWHMHQPHYRPLNASAFRQPWSYLHAIKDYVDMAAILEQTPGARSVVNFAPVLLEQLDAYGEQIESFLAGNGEIADPLLAALASEQLPSDGESRLLLTSQSLRANEQRLIQRFAPFGQLAALARHLLAHPGQVGYLHDQFLWDLLVWYHLAWLGETVRRGDSRITALMEQGNHYSLAQRRLLLSIIGELVQSVIPRYRALAEGGQIELAMSPYGHPILPLLLDIDSAREAMPTATLPAADHYPGGAERARWHLRHGIETFSRYFGMIPIGCWPSEGAVSDATLQLLAAAGFRWAATGESVLRHSLTAAGRMGDACIHHPYRVDGIDIACFFRDDQLSDAIGFKYANWHGDDAAADLVQHLENIAAACGNDPSRVISIILDGENAWEYYPNNGYYFLTALYQKLAQHPTLRLTTFGNLVKNRPKRPPPDRSLQLPSLVAGSWVYGTFSTWIGSPDKNRGWELLIEAKQQFDRVIAAGTLSAEQQQAAEQQLALCEGSDWFWWFGDYNSAESVSDFERLFREHLVSLYQTLMIEPPQSLTQVISKGGGAPEQGGTMRRGSET